MLNVPLSLEFIYLLPGDVSRGYNDWDFKKLQSKLQAIKQRGRQAIVRINFGASCEALAGGDDHNPEPLSLPAWLQKHEEWVEYERVYENNRKVLYPGWDCNSCYPWFCNELLRAVGGELDGDKRVAYLQGFVGHWAEGHVYNGKTQGFEDDVRSGKIFPSKSQYQALLENASKAFDTLRWSVGISLGHELYSPSNFRSLGNFGVFNDTWLDENSGTESWNESLTRALGEGRWELAPRGGEISWAGKSRENGLKLILEGTVLRKDHMTYMFGFDQDRYCYGHSPEDLARASEKFGYNFEVSWKCATSGTDLFLRNNGVAPIYYPTFVSVGGNLVVKDGRRVDLSALLPNQSLFIFCEYSLLNTELPVLVCDRCVDGQTIPYEIIKYPTSSRKRQGLSS